MSVLGTMMLRAGLLSEGQVAAVNEHAATRQLSEADAILELGLADEDTLVAFLASKLMIPRVRSSVLERIGPETLARVAPVVAWDHHCLPASADDNGNLTVVMSDPTDARAIEALAEHTDAYLVRAVATASDLRRALIRHYGPEQQVRDQAASPASAQSQRATELELPAVSPPPSAQSQRATELELPAVSPPPADPEGYTPLGIPDDDDDDDVPIRAPHSAAQEVTSQPTAQSAQPDAPAPAAPYMTAAPEPEPAPASDIPTPAVTPPTSAASPYTVGAPTDIHERPTVIETERPRSPDAPQSRPDVSSADSGPSRGPRRPRRPRAHTPWNPPLAGSPSNPSLPTQPMPSTLGTLPPPPPSAAMSAAATPTAPPAATAPATVPVAPEEPAPAVAATPAGVESGEPVADLASTPTPPDLRPPAPAAAPAPPATPAIPLSPDAFAEVLPSIEQASDRDEVTTVLLDFLAAGFDRVILFVHSHSELRGLDARGKDLLVEAVRQVRIPSGGQSMFATVLERGSPYLGAAPTTTKIDQAFSQALGGIKGNVLLLPIKIGGKVPLLLWAHGTSYPVDPRSITELSAAISDAILRILAARRQS